MGKSNKHWESKFLELQDFLKTKERYPSKKYKVLRETLLAKWITNQRRNQNLSDEKRKRLNSIGFLWDWKEAKKLNYAWEKRNGIAPRKRKISRKKNLPKNSLEYLKGRKSILDAFENGIINEDYKKLLLKNLEG